MVCHILAGFLLLVAPVFVSAQNNVLIHGGDETISSFACQAIDILNIVIGVLTTLAVFIFLWGLAKYVFQADQQEAIKQAKFLMTWGILALFVLVTIWGILQFLYGEFGFTEGFGTFLLPTGNNPAGTCP